MAAFPCQRAILILPKICFSVFTSRSEPERVWTECAILLMVVIKSSARPPKVSVTIGMQEMPADLQLGRLEESFRWTPTSRAWPGVWATWHRCTHAQSAERWWHYLNWTWIEYQRSSPLERQTRNKRSGHLARLQRSWNPSKEYRGSHRGRLKVHSRNLFIYLLTYLLLPAKPVQFSV